MQIVIGSAAGGGFPQWNFNCQNCHSLRRDRFPGPSRTQTQVAVCSDGGHWFFLGASPDLRMQIECRPALHSQGANRHSPITGVLLTNADIDHVVGFVVASKTAPFSGYIAPARCAAF